MSFLLRYPLKLFTCLFIIILPIIGLIRYNKILFEDTFYIMTIIERLQDSLNSTRLRAGKWVSQMSTLTYSECLFGKGKGNGSLLAVEWTLSIDSQFTRTLLADGVVGFFLIICKILYLFKCTLLLPYVRNYVLAFLSSMFILCITFEALLGSVSGLLFWIIYFYFFSNRTTQSLYRKLT